MRVYALLSIFRNRQSYGIIKKSLDEQVNRHLQKYPEDMDILSDSIGISIVTRSYVWLNEKTKKYHSNKDCGGMIEGIRMKYENIDKRIYFPCKRCMQKVDE